MNDCDLHWLAGILEGEGSFIKGPPSAPNQPRVCVNMTDLDIIDRIANYWKVAVIKRKARKSTHKDSYAVTLVGKRAVELMILIKPLMGNRRQGQIDVAVDSFADYSTHNRKLTPTMITEIRSRYANGESGKKIAQSISVNPSTIYDMLKGDTYKQDVAQLG